MRNVQIEIIQEQSFAEVLTGLSVILTKCVEQHACIGFVLPFSMDKANSYWLNTVFENVRKNQCVLLVAKVNHIAVGTVQLQLDMPDNQQHKANVTKLLVHPLYQRQGVAKALMLALEQEALLRARTLLVLDTKTGDSAQALFLAFDYQLVGTIPNFALNTAHDGFGATSIMYKTLSW